MNWRERFATLKPKDAVFLLLFLAISAFLMWKTFGITPEGDLKIAGKVFSDFSATIPLIRSFSYGSNFPPQYPLFAGPPIKYHFVFFAFVALLEKVGLTLPFSLNLVSTVSFFLLLFAIYFLGKTLFNRKVAVISSFLFLFNSSFSFVEFFKDHPISLTTITDIITNTNFPSFGPYDESVVSAFWNLNIYTNQRHLAFAYASFIILVYGFYKYSQKPKQLTLSKAVLIGILVGLFPFVHLAVFGMMGVALASFFLLYPKLRSKILTVGVVSFILALPQLSFLKNSPTSFSLLNPGYLVENLSAINFTEYWFLNLGLTVVLSPLGFILAKKKERKVFIPFLALFVIGNLFQFSVEIAANHKFFNLFVIGANFYTAYLLTIIWEKNILGKGAAVAAVFFLTLSGVIDIFPIINDKYFVVEDIPNNEAATFINKNAPTDSVFLNADFLYDPASLAGRKIYLGWPYFSWSAGYDTDKRHEKMRSILNPENRNALCQELKAEGIDYIEIKNPTNLEGIKPNYSFFENNFARIFNDPESNIAIYKVADSCKS